jgi:hypothetical protein
MSYWRRRDNLQFAVVPPHDVVVMIDQFIEPWVEARPVFMKSASREA